MSRNFYNYDPTVDILQPPLIPDVILKSNLKELTLPTGNQVLESLPLTAWFHRTRSNIISHLTRYEAEWETQKSAARNELHSVKSYLKGNIFNDARELYALPETNILTICAYFAGRIITNRKNWGVSAATLQSVKSSVHRPSLMARVCTSIPSKMVLPWAMAGAVFKELAPTAFDNTITSLESDILDPGFVAQYKTLWRDYYTNGAKKASIEAAELLEGKLQGYIGFARNFIIYSTR
ncbi:AER379Cp [Eremothecium gossypii ATCC 10895]|uniref:MICOS complex subunit MIC27 n=1 Tax=Eremothecium gossypii (strain ATCC 10895 / CBS 109.51 / FGSC 9923 / NRRL Y-1056) TaxID=284811 RepID=MIC27_EREGS|nr:AER379Cp [Eremothecium gossypii ATCC 10895]Q755Y8.1 RecName: Full=MICOS complex subunit MIC27 [Eremothecium gossypii ATCC 10895]AAS53059.1 AER379Cp [Eremothecium gossypii ATCC 10895]AEY97367.1 FAER379Cp [Eremothecium gossypii FDAG1]